MESKSGKRILNLIMVLLIGAMIACGVIIVGNLKGWFHREKTPTIVAGKVTGVVNIERSGIGYSLERDVCLRDADIITTKKGSWVELNVKDDNAIILGENSALQAEACQDMPVQLRMDCGESFADFAKIADGLMIALPVCEVKPRDAVFCLQQQTGSASISVLAGEIQVIASDGTQEHARAGELLSVLETESGEVQISSAKLQAESLNDFLLDQALRCSSINELCFNAAELNAVVDERAAQKQAALEESMHADLIRKEMEAETEAAGKTEQGQAEEEAGTTDPDIEEADPEDGAVGSYGAYIPGYGGGEQYDNQSQQPAQGTVDESYGNEDSADDGDEIPVYEEVPSNQEEYVPEVQEPVVNVNTCTIAIYCDTILNNMEDLTPGKEAYVPANGCILAPSRVEFTSGETVFDVLTRVCEYAGIQIEYSWTPMYGSYYIEGLNHLYEFDCGNESGWMYKVNGWFPNYGCSSYELADGDNIVWCYTCKGLGADVGGGMF